jgi:hypothetical protein
MFEDCFYENSYKEEVDEEEEEDHLYSSTTSTTTSINDSKDFFNHNSFNLTPRKFSPIPTTPIDPSQLMNESDTNIASLQRPLSTTQSVQTVQNNNDKSQLTMITPLINDDSQSSMSFTTLNNKSKMSTCLDKWYKELKDQILCELEETKIKMFKQQQIKLLKEKEEQSIEINQLLNKLNEIKLENQKKDEQILNLNETINKQKQKHDLFKAMTEWKMKKVEISKEVKHKKQLLTIQLVLLLQVIFNFRLFQQN